MASNWLLSVLCFTYYMLYSFCKCLYFCPWCPVHAKAAFTLQLIWRCGLLLQPHWHWRLWHIQSHSRAVWVVDVASLPEFLFSLIVVTCSTTLLSTQVARKLRCRHPIHIQCRHTEFLPCCCWCYLSSGYSVEFLVHCQWLGFCCLNCTFVIVRLSLSIAIFGVGWCNSMLQ